jgi:hypothetical protein
MISFDGIAYPLIIVPFGDNYSFLKLFQTLLHNDLHVSIHGNYLLIPGVVIKLVRAHNYGKDDN